MAKRPYGETAGKVLNFFQTHRNLSSYAIGKKLDLHPAYIRKVISRSGLKLARSPNF